MAAVSPTTSPPVSNYARRLNHAMSLVILPTPASPAPNDKEEGRRLSSESPRPVLATRASGGSIIPPSKSDGRTSPHGVRTAKSPIASAQGNSRTNVNLQQKQLSLSNIPAEISAQLGEAAPRPLRPRIFLESIPERMPNDAVLPLPPGTLVPVPVAGPQVSTHHPLRPPPSARGLAVTVSVAAGSAAAARLAAQEEAAEASAVKAQAENLEIKQKIWNLLFVGDLTVLVRICRTTQFSSGPTLANAIIALLRQQGNAESFLRQLLTDRIRCAQTVVNSNDIVNILRDNSLAVLLLNAFTRHEGGPYLRQTLQPAMIPVLENAAGYEIDPRLVPEGEDIVANRVRVVEAVVRVITRLQEQESAMPLALRRLCVQIRTECMDRMIADNIPHDRALSESLKVVGCYFCLRFFGPAVTSPEILRLDATRNIGLKERRACLIVAKILMPVAADMILGRKEAYLEPLNPLLAEARAMMRAYLLAVSEPHQRHKSRSLLRSEREAYVKATKSIEPESRTRSSVVLIRSRSTLNATKPTPTSSPKGKAPTNPSTPRTPRVRSEDDMVSTPVSSPYKGSPPSAKDASNSAEAREHLRKLAEDMRQMASGEEVALPSPTLELHVTSQKRARSSSIASISLAMPITFEIALDTVLAFMRANMSDIEDRFVADRELAALFAPLKELVLSVDVGPARRRSNHVILEPTPAETLETMTEFLQGVRNKQRQRFRQWQASVIASFRSRPPPSSTSTSTSPSTTAPTSSTPAQAAMTAGNATGSGSVRPPHASASPSTWFNVFRRGRPRKSTSSTGAVSTVHA